jgi:acyltransferase
MRREHPPAGALEGEKNLTRIAWVDRAKGWGMILVMAGHGDIPFRLALSFVPVPIFFFLSGFLHREWKYTSIRHLIRVRARTLLVPYFLFALLNAGVWLGFHRSVLSQGWKAVLLPLAGQIVAGRRTDEDPYLIPYWFILCLFLTEVIYSLLVRAGAALAARLGGRELAWRLLLMTAVTGAGFVFVNSGRRALPWSLDIALIAVAFFGGGHIAQLHVAKFELLFRKTWLIAPSIAGVLLGVWNVEAGTRYRVGLYDSYYHNPLLFLVGAYAGLYLFLLAMFRIPDFKPVQVIGRESLAFLVLHYPIFLPLGAFVDSIFARPVFIALFAGSPVLHSLTLRTLKAVTGTAVTVAGLVVAYLLIAPIAAWLRKHLALLTDGRRRTEASGAGEVALSGPGVQLSDPVLDALNANRPASS